jgi:glycosyltransferase involved in cell wall biosynthesis
VRVALITVAYPPLRYSAAVQMRDLAQEFLAQGHEPVVLTPDPTLPSSWELEIVDGIQVLRLRALRTRDVDYVRRTIGEFVLPWAMLHGFRASPLAGTQWDAIVWYSPSIFFGPLVRALKRSSPGSRSYLILRDIFPEAAVDIGVMRRGGAVFRMFKLIEKQQHTAADVIGIQAPSNRAFLPQLDGRPGVRLEVLWNWLSPATTAACRIDVSQTPLAGRTIFVYAGNMGVAQSLDIVLDLAERLRDRTDIGFLLVGRGSEDHRLRINAAQRKLENVLFHDEINPEEVPGLLAQCHVGLLMLDTRHRTHNIPGKFLAYIQGSIPVLARINENNDLVGLIESEGVGRVVKGESVEAFQEAVAAMAADPVGRGSMANRGGLLSEKLFSSKSAVRQIVHSLTDAWDKPHAG